MELFYKIPLIIAQQIGIFEYDKSLIFDPFTNEQKDNTFIISVNLIDQLKHHPKIKNINWDFYQKIDNTKIDSKEI